MSADNSISTCTNQPCFSHHIWPSARSEEHWHSRRKEHNPPVGILFLGARNLKTHLRNGIVFSSFFAILNCFCIFSMLWISDQVRISTLLSSSCSCEKASFQLARMHSRFFFRVRPALIGGFWLHNLMPFEFPGSASDFSSFRKQNCKKTSRH